MRAMRTFSAFVVLAVTLIACDGDENAAVAPTRDATTLASPTVVTGTVEVAPTPPRDLPVIELRYDGGAISVELALTTDDRALGLGERDSLPIDSGMLFDLGENRVPGFWMKGMRFPIDMVWIDENKTIVGVANDVQPQPGVPDEDLRRYSPAEPVRYVLEVNAGEALRREMVAGDVVEFELP
jgi:uncharacterized membrane protein (UPF0127 family)